MNTNTQIHEYLGEYVSKSIMLELTVLNKRGGGESSVVERGHTIVLNKWNEWEERSLAMMSLGTYIGNGYLQMTPWWG